MAADIILTADTGRTTGTRSSRRMRAEGRIPAVVYGAGTDPASVSVEWRDLRAALTTDAGLNALITLQVDGQDKLTLVKDLQRHPIRRDVLHVDFVVVDRDIAVQVDVPLVLVGADGDNLKGLVVDQVHYTLSIEAKPGSIPNEIEVDLSGLAEDSPVTVGDLRLPAGVTTHVEATDAVVTAARPAAEIVPGAEAAEAAEGAPEAEAEADGGEAGAGDDAGDEG